MLILCLAVGQHCGRVSGCECVMKMKVKPHNLHDSDCTVCVCLCVSHMCVNVSMCEYANVHVYCPVCRLFSSRQPNVLGV